MPPKDEIKALRATIKGMEKELSRLGKKGADTKKLQAELDLKRRELESRVKGLKSGQKTGESAMFECGGRIKKYK